MGGSRRSFCAGAALLLAGCAGATQRPPRAPSRSSAPSGKLRAAINFGNPILAAEAPAVNRAASRSTSRAKLARRLGVAVELVLFDSAGKVVEAVKARPASTSPSSPIDPVRAADMEYTAPYVIIEGAYLVRSDSPLQRNEEVDRAGTRVAVGRGSAYDLFLTRELKTAHAGARADVAGGHRPVPRAEARSRRRRQAAAGGGREARLAASACCRGASW